VRLDDELLAGRDVHDEELGVARPDMQTSPV